MHNRTPQNGGKKSFIGFKGASGHYTRVTTPGHKIMQQRTNAKPSNATISINTNNQHIAQYNNKDRCHMYLSHVPHEIEHSRRRSGCMNKQPILAYQNKTPEMVVTHQY